MSTPPNCDPKLSIQRHDNCEDDYGMMKMKEEKEDGSYWKGKPPWAYSQQFISLYL